MFKIDAFLSLTSYIFLSHSPPARASTQKKPSVTRFIHSQHLSTLRCTSDCKYDVLLFFLNRPVLKLSIIQLDFEHTLAFLHIFHRLLLLKLLKHNESVFFCPSYACSLGFSAIWLFEIPPKLTLTEVLPAALSF